MAKELAYLSEGLASRRPKASHSIHKHCNLTGVQFWELPLGFAMPFRHASDKNPSFLTLLIFSKECYQGNAGFSC